MTTKEEEESHEVTATYSGGLGHPYYQPCMLCSCGFSAREVSWEEAGWAYDQHLKEIDQQ